MRGPTKINKDVLKSMIQEGFSVKEIAYSLGINTGAIYTALSRMKVRSSSSPEIRHMEMADYSRSHGTSATAKKFNVSENTVVTARRKYAKDDMARNDFHGIKRSPNISRSRRPDLPVGIYFDKRTSKYVSYDNKRRIGRYPCMYQAWMARVMYRAGELKR